MKMYLISDNIDTSTGMRLAGIEGAVVHEKEELKAELNLALSDKYIAVVVLTEMLGQYFPEVFAEARQGRSLPLLGIDPGGEFGRGVLGKLPDDMDDESVLLLGGHDRDALVGALDEATGVDDGYLALWPLGIVDTVVAVGLELLHE